MLLTVLKTKRRPILVFLILAFTTLQLGVIYGRELKQTNGTDYTCTVPKPSKGYEKWNTPTVISTFNIKFLIQAKEGQGPFANDPQKTFLHLDTIAKEISEFNSDIWLIQELGDCIIFKQFRDRIAYYNPNDYYQYYLVQTPDTTTNQSTGILTKYTPSAPVYRATYSTHYPIPGSDCKNLSMSGDTELTKHNIALYAGSFEKQFGFKLAVIGILFQTMDSGCVIRQAEATNLKKIATDLVSKGYEIIITGDLNDVANKFKDVNNTIPSDEVSNIVEDGYPELINQDITIPYSQRYSVTGPEVIMDNKLQFPLEVRLIDMFYCTKALAKAFIKINIPHDQRTDLEPSGLYPQYSNHWPVLSYWDFTKVKGKGY